jgi:hypothetical protein
MALTSSTTDSTPTASGALHSEDSLRILRAETEEPRARPLPPSPASVWDGPHYVTVTNWAAPLGHPNKLSCRTSRTIRASK